MCVGERQRETETVCVGESIGPFLCLTFGCICHIIAAGGTVGGARCPGTVVAVAAAPGTGSAEPKTYGAFDACRDTSGDRTSGDL